MAKHTLLSTDRVKEILLAEYSIEPSEFMAFYVNAPRRKRSAASLNETQVSAIKTWIAGGKRFNQRDLDALKAGLGVKGMPTVYAMVERFERDSASTATGA